MTSPLCKCLVGKTKPGQRCAKQGSGDFQQQGRKRNWFPLAPGATRLETCCLWPDPVFRHCWLIFWPIPAGSQNQASSPYSIQHVFSSASECMQNMWHFHWTCSHVRLQRRKYYEGQTMMYPTCSGLMFPW